MLFVLFSVFVCEFRFLFLPNCVIKKNIVFVLFLLYFLFVFVVCFLCWFLLFYFS